VARSWLANIFALVNAPAWLTGGDQVITVRAPTVSLLELPVSIGHLTWTVTAYYPAPPAPHDRHEDLNDLRAIPKHINIQCRARQTGSAFIWARYAQAIRV